eukprot:5983150-Pleurochrysis_carterae.AAC.2
MVAATRPAPRSIASDVPSMPRPKPAVKYGFPSSALGLRCADAENGIRHLRDAPRLYLCGKTTS